MKLFVDIVTGETKECHIEGPELEKFLADNPSVTVIDVSTRIDSEVPKVVNGKHWSHIDTCPNCQNTDRQKFMNIYCGPCDITAEVLCFNCLTSIKHIPPEVSDCHWNHVSTKEKIQECLDRHNQWFAEDEERKEVNE